MPKTFDIIFLGNYTKDTIVSASRKSSWAAVAGVTPALPPTPPAG